MLEKNKGIIGQLKNIIDDYHIFDTEFPKQISRNILNKFFSFLLSIIIGTGFFLVLFFGLYSSFMDVSQSYSSQNGNSMDLSVHVSLDETSNELERDRSEETFYNLEAEAEAEAEAEERTISDFNLEEPKGGLKESGSGYGHIQKTYRRFKSLDERENVNHILNSTSHSTPIFDLRKVSGRNGDVPNLLKGVVTHYPEFEYIQKIEGQVVLKLDINENGYVESWEVLEGDLRQGFVQASIEMVQTWQFEPYLVQSVNSEFKGSKFILIKMFHFKL
ncbi:TonB family protein [bacterium]|nr:TonB family protein [bacterium]